jgi:integrase
MQEAKMPRVKREIKYFSVEEAKAFLSPLRGARDRLAFHLLYHYGLRVSELAGLRLSDFTPSLADPTELHITRLKGGISRHYPIRDDDRRRLRDWLRERGIGGEWLFPGTIEGQPLRSVTWQKTHDRYARAVLPPDRRLSIHKWRHSCAIHLLMNGADVKLVKDWLGHAELENTLIYVDLAPSHWTEYGREALRRFAL